MSEFHGEGRKPFLRIGPVIAIEDKVFKHLFRFETFDTKLGVTQHTYSVEVIAKCQRRAMLKACDKSRIGYLSYDDGLIFLKSVRQLKGKS